MRESRRSHLIGTPLAELPASLSASTASAVAMMTTMQTTQRPCTAQRSSFAGSSLRLPAAAPPRQQLRMAASAAEKTAEKKEKTEKWSAPALDPSWPSPIFGGSTGGLLRKAQVCGPTLWPHPPTGADESPHRLLHRGAVSDAVLVLSAAPLRSVAAIRCERVAMPTRRDLDSAVLHVESICSMSICIPCPLMAHRDLDDPGVSSAALLSAQGATSGSTVTVSYAALVGPRDSAQSAVFRWTPPQQRTVDYPRRRWFSRVGLTVLRRPEY